MRTLKQAERFPREVANKLFELELEPLTREMQGLLTEEEIEGFVYRVKHAREYLRSLRRAAPRDSAALVGPGIGGRRCLAGGYPSRLSVADGGSVTAIGKNGRRRWLR